MKQLLIVNSAKALNAKKDSAGAAVTPNDFSNLAEGAISLFELGGSAVLSAAPTKNFGIALGSSDNVLPFIIPEIDINNLYITVTQPSAGQKFKAEITIPTPVEGNNYTLVLVKKGTSINERFKFTATEFVPAGASMTAAAIATSLGNQFKNYVSNGTLDIKVTVSSAKITIESNNYTDQYELVASDKLHGVSVTTTPSKPNIGDKSYIKTLAQQCAAGKGFNYLAEDASEIYPGYPESVEDIAQADIATKGYAVFNLRFATHREAGKTTDEAVWQYVHIAVPKNNSSYSTIATMLPEGRFKVASAAAPASNS